MPRSGGDPVSDALRDESRRLALECVRLRAGLAEALASWAAWTEQEYSGTKFYEGEMGKIAELRKLLGGES